MVESMVDEYSDNPRSSSLDVDANPKTMKFGVQSIPNLPQFKNGEPVERLYAQRVLLSAFVHIGATAAQFQRAAIRELRGSIGFLFVYDECHREVTAT